VIRFWLLVLIAMLVGGATAYALRFETGYVLIGYRQWVVETSLLGLLLTTIASVAVVVYGFRLLSATVRLPGTVSDYLSRRRERRARKTFERGLTYLLEGNWRQAEVELLRHVADHDEPFLNYLFAARAAQRLGEIQRRDHYLSLASYNSPDNMFAILLTQAELEYERADHAAAQAALVKLHAYDPAHPYVLQLLTECHVALGQWDALLTLLRATERTQPVGPQRHRELLARALSEQLDAAAARGELDRLRAIWKNAGDDGRDSPRVRERYASGLVRLQVAGEAAEVIEAGLDEAWDDALCRLYRQLQGGDRIGHLASTERWIAKYGDRPELLLTAGVICYDAKLWGKARGYLDAAVQRQPSVLGYHYLMLLSEQIHAPDEAAQFARRGLELAARG
jgi:HemY protein